MPDRIDDRADLFVMFANALFEFGKLSREFAICFKHLAQLHERAHDGNVDLQGALASQHA